MKFALEICAGSIASAYSAQSGGADRVELCDNLWDGGTTPSLGVIKTVKEHLSLPVFPIIRPRGGDFVYSNQEFQAMKWDIKYCRDLYCDGVVFGILDTDGQVDVERCQQLIDLAGPMQLTFHRAFDLCTDMETALEDIASLGFHRILTSGGEQYAHQALPRLKLLVEQAGQRLKIMPGAGITKANIQELIQGTGAVEFHSTAKAGPADADPGEFGFFETDPEEVAALAQILKNQS